MELRPKILKTDGKPAFAVLTIEEYESLKTRLDDLEDLLALRKAKDAESGAETISLEDARRELQA